MFGESFVFNDRIVDFLVSLSNICRIRWRKCCEVQTNAMDLTTIRGPV